MVDQKISIDELRAQLKRQRWDKKTLRRYFKTSDALSKSPFNPEIVPDPDTVALPPPGDPTLYREYFGFGETVILLQREERAEWFDHMRIIKPHPIIVSRGDSWFLHPLLTDLIDNLRGGYAIRSFDWPGDTLVDIEQEDLNYKKAIQDLNANIFLLSGGGNDAIGGGNLANFLMNYDSSISNPADYLNDGYREVVNISIGKIEKIIKEVLEIAPDIEILCHGYDYVIPNKGQWLGNPMIGKGITDLRLQKAITNTMIDFFNDRLASLARSFGRQVHYVNLRKSVTAGWDDELHPTDDGFRQAASYFVGVLKSIPQK